MKRLLFFSFISTILLSSCSGNRYNSRYEAKKACHEWENNGITYFYEDDDYVRDEYGRAIDPYEWTIKVKTRDNRDCIEEYDTRQYIGEEIISVKENAFYEYDEWKELEKNIKYKYTHFYYPWF